MYTITLEPKIIAQECTSIEESESHPAEKVVLCVKKKNKVFSNSFFCSLYKKKAVGSGLVRFSSPIFYFKKKNEQALSPCSALFFIEGDFQRAFFLHAEDKNGSLRFFSHQLPLFLLSLPVPFFFFDRERKTCN